MVFYGGGQTSTSSSKKISGILRAANHFDTLQLPKPYADLAGEPVWNVSEEQVAKGFRKLSLCCHPDKSSDPEAPTAFEQLKKAKACLLNELQHGQSAPLGSAPTRLLRLFRRALAAPGSPALRGREVGPLVSQPGPRMLELAASEAADFPAFDHVGARQGRLRARLRQECGDAVGGQLGAGGGGAEQQAARECHARRGAAGAG